MFKNKYISLYLLWAFGLIMIIYFSLAVINDNKRDNSDASLIKLLEETGHTDLPDAYVLVTIDKKHFLTRFRSYIPEKVSTPMDRVTTRQDVERVLTKIKPVTRNKKPEDFTIKPTPSE